jgi:phosphotransferase system enzyme I (PtsP)
MTGDGQPVELMINAGLTIDLPHIDETARRLFAPSCVRGEPQPPRSGISSRSQHGAGCRRHRPVTFRTLDIGGDRALPYMETVVEENPALGWRAIRLGLDRPGLLRGQVRPLAGRRRSCAEDHVPMTRCRRVHQAKAIVERELTYLRQHGHSLPERRRRHHGRGAGAALSTR